MLRGGAECMEPSGFNGVGRPHGDAFCAGRRGQWSCAGLMEAAWRGLAGVRAGSLAEKCHGQGGHDDADDLVFEIFQGVDLRAHRKLGFRVADEQLVEPYGSDVRDRRDEEQVALCRTLTRAELEALQGK